jgi:hypothetical protein
LGAGRGRWGVQETRVRVVICHLGRELCKALERLQIAGGRCEAGGGVCLPGAGMAVDMAPGVCVCVVEGGGVVC